MSASGKSSNRHSEYNRGYLGGGGHGIYAEWGKRDRERELARREAAAKRRSPVNQRDIYSGLKYYNDGRAVYRALQKGSLDPILRRIGRRIYGKASGQLARRIFG